MFWGLLKMMACLVLLPLRIILKATKIVVILALPILAIGAIKKIMHK
jgi:hypothetical protein